MIFSKNMIDVSTIPTNSGVYIFKDSEKILYIGKALSLRKRVKSYFQKGRNRNSVKTEFLTQKIESIEWIITNNEVEALILENNLIKKHKPPYNIRLVDDKTYPYIKIDFSKKFPFIEITRSKSSKSSVYFGPYTSALKLRDTLKFVYKNFPLRRCKDSKFKSASKPCLNYQIKLCPAPCCEKISESEYRKNLKKLILFLKGKNKKLLKELETDMLRYSDNLQFEKAASIRDLINNIKLISENQIMEHSSFFSKDIFCCEYDDESIFLIVLRVRRGKVLDSDFFTFKNLEIDKQSFFEEFIPKYYNFKDGIPEKIVIQEQIDTTLLLKFFDYKYSKKIKIGKTADSDEEKLLQLASKNLKERILYSREKDSFLQKIMEKLKLKKIPQRIDAFDIATFQGKSSVGTRVVFKNGKPLKKYYRKYNIKSIEENYLNDFAMINEVVLRSSKEYLISGEKPDLILIDGGKGQLNAALAALKNYGLDKEIDIISIAKEHEKNIDRLYLPNIKNPLNMSKNPEIVKYFMMIRDEVHRFSVNFHNRKEESKNLSSILENIKGISKKRAAILMNHFKSIDAIKLATPQDIALLPSMNLPLAESIVSYLNKIKNE